MNWLVAACVSLILLAMHEHYRDPNALFIGFAIFCMAFTIMSAVEQTAIALWKLFRRVFE